jgi:hypothetical protein
MRIVLLVLLTISGSFSELPARKQTGNDPIICPVNPPFLFAGSFGELRPNHFHSGLDFRTRGQTGMPVFAVKDGYVSRIGVSPTGYGNALYMNHSDGTTTVYGHLEKFHPDIQKYVREKQYDKEIFPIDLTLSPNEFYFKKGDIIARSGNSGSSGGPHLHFEIRATDSERAVNPLFYNLGIKDNSAPKIRAFYAYPLTANSNVGPDRTKKRFEVVAVQGGYRLKNNLPVELYGKIGFAIQADDDFNGTGLKCGIYSAALFCDGIEIFGFKMNSFSFADSRYANAQADYEAYIQSHRWIQKLYRQPGNHLDIYNHPDNNGVLNLDDGESHEFEIIAADAFKNKTSLKFRTIPKKSKLPDKNQNFSKQFLFDQSNYFENENIRIDLPNGTLYDNIGFVWKSAPKPVGCFSELHQVHSKFIPLQKSYSLSIRCNDLPKPLTNKALIVNIEATTGHKSAIGGEYSRGWVTVKTNVFGSFAVAIDKTPPVILPLSIKDKKVLTDNNKLQFKITDDLSGIKTYRGEIDGEWILFEYDAKSKLLTYIFDKDRMAFGKNHLLRLVVTDNKENSSEYKALIYK